MRRCDSCGVDLVLPQNNLFLSTFIFCREQILAFEVNEFEVKAM